MLACHAGGRGFESRPLRHLSRNARRNAGVLLLASRKCGRRLAGRIRMHSPPQGRIVWAKSMALDGGSRPALHCAATLSPLVGYPMLQAIREKTSGWIATVILGFIALLLVPFGISQYQVQRNEDFAARVEAPPSWWPSAPSWWP